MTRYHTSGDNGVTKTPLYIRATGGFGDGDTALTIRRLEAYY